MFPAFLDLTAKKVVVVGGGPVALSKVEGLLRAGADVTVVAPVMHPELVRPGVVLIERAFEPSDLDDAWWVVAAAPPAVNQAVRAAGDARHVFVNAVDDPDRASAYLGGVIRRAGITIAVSTGGRAPALAGLLREAIDAWLPADLDRWVDAADAARASWRRNGVIMGDRRPQLLEVLNGLYGRTDESRE
jgi:siroheme synthase-like protein